MPIRWKPSITWSSPVTLLMGLLVLLGAFMGAWIGYDISIHDLGGAIIEAMTWRLWYPGIGLVLAVGVVGVVLGQQWGRHLVVGTLVFGLSFGAGHWLGPKEAQPRYATGGSFRVTFEPPIAMTYEVPGLCATPRGSDTVDRAETDVMRFRGVQFGVDLQLGSRRVIELWGAVPYTSPASYWTGHLEELSLEQDNTAGRASFTASVTSRPPEPRFLGNSIRGSIEWECPQLPARPPWEIITLP